MKNINIKKYLKTLIAMGTLSFVLVTTGCSSKENNAEPSNEITTETDNNEQNNKTDTNEEEFDNFASEETTLNELIYTENFELAKEYWSDKFITVVDFIFYDSEYKGTTWNELTNTAKKECIERVINIDKKICEIYPEYKEDLEKVKNFAANTYYSGLEKIKELIGEDKYNDIKEVKDKFKNIAIDKAHEIGNNIKDKANELYQEYKRKNK